MSSQTYNWLERVIFSCETIEQVEATKKLTQNFESMYPETDTKELHNAITIRLANIMKI